MMKVSNVSRIKFLLALVCLSAPLSQGDAQFFGKKQPKLTDTPLNSAPRPDVNGRHFLVHSATYHYNIAGLVGHALYIAKKADGTCPTENDREYNAVKLSVPSYVKDGVALVINDKLNGAPSYQSKLDQGANVDFKAIVFGTSAHAQYVADVALTDVQTASVPANGWVANYETDILSKVADNECDVFLITGATVSTVSTKWYQKWDGSSDIAAAAFSAGGKVYQETSESNVQFLIAIEPQQIRVVAPRGGGRLGGGALTTKVLRVTQRLPAKASAPKTLTLPANGVFITHP